MSKKKSRTVESWRYIILGVMVVATVAVALPDVKAKEETIDTPVKTVIHELAITNTEAVKATITETTEEVTEAPTTVEETTIPETTEPETTVPETTEAPLPLYTVDGDLIDERYQEFMYRELSAHDIEWWMPYAVLTMYQESQGNPNDITGGIDCGILQYRKTFWEETCAKWGFPDADIFDPFVQMSIYVKQTARRINELSLDKYEVISRHKQSDWGSYDEVYVDQVLGHDLVQIR